MKNSWAKQALQHYQLLKNWRKYTPQVVKACKEVLGNHCKQIYITGGAAENRLTVQSDIDILAITANPQLKTPETIIKIKRKAQQLGTPPQLPLDIKILTPQELQQQLEKGIIKKLIPLP